MQYITKTALSEQIKDELDKLKLTAEIIKFETHEVAKPTTANNITIVAVGREAQDYCDYYTTRPQASDIHDYINEHLKREDVDKNKIHLFPIYRITNKDSDVSASSALKGNEVIGFAYITKTAVRDYFGDRSERILENLANQLVDVSVSDLTAWKQGSLYQLKIKRDGGVVWDSDVIYNISSWDFYIDCVLKNLKKTDLLHAETN